MVDRSDPVVLVHERGTTLIITLNRPHVRNAVNGELSELVASALDQLDESPDLRVGVLTGAGSAFCSGMDLKALPVEGPATSHRGFGGITGRPPLKPVIAAVEGYALAGGFEIALACDLIVAAEDALFGIPEVKRGLIASSGGLTRLGASLPYQTAMRVALTGEPIDAKFLHNLGLVSHLAPSKGALGVAMELAAVVGANAPLALAASKDLGRRAAGLTGNDLAVHEARLAASIMASADATEGPLAFVEKRQPVWKGR